MRLGDAAVVTFFNYCVNCVLLCVLRFAGDGADEDLQENLALQLSKCPAGGVVDGTVLEISDFTQNLDVSCYSTKFNSCPIYYFGVCCIVP